MNHIEFDALMKIGIEKKPKDLIISDLNWKYLIRCVLREENILLVGPTGCGKTMTAKLVSETIGRPFFKYNLGSTQDARASLIGNTSLKKEVGTIFHKSSFVTAITTPNAIVLLDELTRGSHDSWNIIMSAIDPNQRELRLDEHEEGRVEKVAKGVCFIATANIGSQYTSTRVLDEAISNRFPIKIEMEHLSSDQLKNLCSIKFPSRTPKQAELMDMLISIIDDIRIECKKEDSLLSTPISNRSLVSMAGLVIDGFSLLDIAEVAIYPEYNNDGGPDSERTYVKQIIQNYIPVNASNPIKDPRKKNK